MTPPLPLSQRLKTDTQDLHTRAERHPVQRALVSGVASAEAYAAYLAQMYWAHQGFEASLRGATLRDPALALLVRDHHFRLSHLYDDLAHLGVEAESTTPTPAAARFAAWNGHLARTEPASLIGVLYVLEGSTNGGRFIARALRRALAVPGADGLRYLDPHGEEQGARWGEFKEVLDSLPLSPLSADRIVEAAQATFRAVYDIFEGLYPQESIVAEDSPAPVMG